MQSLRLSPNGIDKLIGSLNNITVQIISVEEKFQNNQCYYSVELNDGFCKIKACIIDSMETVEKQKLMDFMVIRVQKSAIQKNKKQKLIVIVEGYELVTDRVSGVVGAPINYDEYIKNGKNNPDGENLVPVEKGAQQAKRESKSVDHEPFEESKNNFQNVRGNKEQGKNAQKGNANANSNTNSRLASNATSNNANSKQNLVTKQMDKRAGSLPRAEIKPKPGPIEKIPAKKQDFKTQSNQVGRQKKPNSEYTQIRSLYVGMQNWIILGRIISLNPVKTFINKKGIQSFILAFQIGDKTGVIQCNIFGQTANKFENILKEDQVYEIANGVVNENSYLGAHKLKINLMESSKVNIKEDDPNIPYLEDFCVTVKKLTEVAVGEQARVICLVKDEQEIEAITTKEGKAMRKKMVTLCDPVDKVQVDITVWNDSCQMKFEKYPYLIKGVMVKEYQGNRQYSLKANYKATLLKQHGLRKYIKDLEHINFANPDSNNKPKRTSITNFKDLNNAMDEVSNAGTWSEVVCFIIAIRLSAKNYYVSCPKCKRKVGEIQNSTCVNCDHFYQQAKFRYVMNMNVSDYTDSIWVTAYDEGGEAMMGISADEYSRLTQEQVQEHMKKVRYRHRKLKLVTKNQEFQGNVRKKTSIIKVMDVNYAEEARLLMEKVRQMIGK